MYNTLLNSTNYGRPLAMLFVCCSGASMLSAGESPEAIVQKMNEWEGRRTQQLRESHGTRRYVLTNERWNKNAEMQVEAHYQRGQGKSFRMLAATGSEDIQNRVFKKLLETETEASKSADLDPSEITVARYNLKLLGQEVIDGRKCYVLQINPKHKSKFLIEGKAWIDAAEYGLVRLEGRPSASVSFWVGRPFITQNFAKVGDQWLASSNHSIAESRLFGRTELHIEYTRYSVNGSGTLRVAANHSFEANSSVN